MNSGLFVTSFSSWSFDPRRSGPLLEKLWIARTKREEASPARWEEQAWHYPRQRHLLSISLLTPRRSAHLDPERNCRWAEHCGSVNEIGAKTSVHGSTMERECPRMLRELRPRLHR